MIDTAITFTYKVLDIDFPRDGLERCTLEITLAGDVYLVTAEREEDEGWDIGVTLEGVDQYWEYTDPERQWLGGKDRDTHFSRTISQDWLEDWIGDDIFLPVERAMQAAVQAALKAMDGATGTVDWKTDE